MSPMKSIDLHDFSAIENMRRSCYEQECNNNNMISMMYIIVLYYWYEAKLMASLVGLNTIIYLVRLQLFFHIINRPRRLIPSQKRKEKSLKRFGLYCIVVSSVLRPHPAF